MMAVLGLTLGVAVLVVSLSVVNGFERELRERVLQLVPHVSIYDGDLSSTHAQRMREAFTAHPDVLGFTPFAEGLVLASLPGRVLGGQLLGMTGEGIREVTILEQFLAPGSTLPDKPYELLIGSRAAQELDTSIGDRLTLTLPAATVTPMGLFPRRKTFVISGIFTTGTELDQASMVARLEDVQRFFARLPAYRGWRLQLAEMFRAEEISWELSALSPSSSYSNWIRTHGGLYRAIAMQKSIMWLLLSLVVGVATFNVASSLGMLILKKESDIAILMSMGSSKRLIIKIFFWLACFICCAGIVPGLLLGVGMTLVLGDLTVWIEDFTGVNLLEEYFVRYLPVQVQIGDLLMITVISVLLCTLTSVLPARRAAAVLPAEVLRNE